MTFSQALMAGLIASGLILSCSVSESRVKPRTGKKVAMEYLKTDKKLKKLETQKRSTASLKKSAPKSKKPKKKKR